MLESLKCLLTLFKQKFFTKSLQVVTKSKLKENTNYAEEMIKQIFHSNKTDSN